MSTAFMLRYNACDCCGRYDEIHMGNSYRILRAYEEIPGLDFGPVQSWADWEKILRSGLVRVFDEYGKERDIEAIIAPWQPMPNAAAESNSEWCARFGHGLGDYTDPDGFHMSVRAFS